MNKDVSLMIKIKAERCNREDEWTLSLRFGFNPLLWNVKLPVSELTELAKYRKRWTEIKPI